MFALYTSSFTKSANQAIANAETEDGDRAMAKRWDTFKKFETNFNHWYVSDSATSYSHPYHHCAPGSR